MSKIEIVNVVATASLNQQIDFDELRKFREILHDSDVYGGRVAYFKTARMKGKVSIFLSGKMISVGTKSEVQAFKELDVAQQFLSKKGLVKLVKLHPKTQNLVVTADFQKAISLEKLSEDLNAIYEPEQFSGAILRFTEPYKTSILVFASGKVVITGLRTSAQIEPTIEKLAQLLEANQ